jgi:hypothetical protein
MTGKLNLRATLSGLTVLGTLAVMSVGTAIAAPAEASITAAAGHQAPQILRCAPCFKVVHPADNICDC